MLKLFGGGGNGSGGSGRARWQGKSFRVQQYHVTVEDVLAEGGFALVFQVKSGRGQRYALKRMAVNSEQDLYLSRQEIAITKALSDCPNSVTFLASSISQTAPDVHEVLILMQLYSGGRVVDMMNARLASGFSEPEVLKIFTDVCQAVARLHHRTKPIIHRDLKAENILRDTEGNFVLCDYGSCTVKPMHPEVMGAAECEEQISRFTTLSYRAPEMISLFSGKTVTTKSDIWALGCLLYKLCFFTNPFGEQPLAIVSGTFTIPDDSKFTEGLHSLIRYMLEPDPDQRPNIWQVAEVAFRLRKMRNPISNVFHTSPPPHALPIAQRTKDSKSTPPRAGSKTMSTSSMPSNSSSHQPVARVSSSSTQLPSTRNDSYLNPVTAMVASRERPRARPRTPSPHVSGPAHLPAHLLPPSQSPATLARSLDSGLNKYGHAGHDGSLDQFGQPYFTPQHTGVGLGGSPLPRRSSDPTRDEFGQAPFVSSEGHTHSGNRTPIRASDIDEFGAPVFTRSCPPPSHPPAHLHPSHPLPHSSPGQAADLFGSRPFVQQTDAFGSAPFVTS